jgi:hypothetical protein
VIVIVVTVNLLLIFKLLVAMILFRWLLVGRWALGVGQLLIIGQPFFTYFQRRKHTAQNIYPLKENLLPVSCIALCEESIGMIEHSFAYMVCLMEALFFR